MRFGGRATVTVPPFVEAEFGACLALLGGFFADMEGEGEDEDGAPFVWMPAGIGRFVFGWGGMTGGGIGVVLGAMATGALLQQTARRAAGEAPRPDAVADAWSPVLERARLGLLPRLLQHTVRGAVRSHLARWNCTLLGFCERVCRFRRWSTFGARWSCWWLDCGLSDGRALKESRGPALAVQRSGTMGDGDNSPNSDQM